MNAGADKPLPFWRTVRLLWKASRTRAQARMGHQRKLLRQRKGSSGNAMAGFGMFFAVIVMIGIHVMMGFQVSVAVRVGAYVEEQNRGRIAVSENSFQRLSRPKDATDVDQVLDSESWDDERYLGGKHADHEVQLKNQYKKFGRAGFVSTKQVPHDLESIAKASPLAQLCGGVMLLWWFIMLVFQGEGLELDIQRRRHPMWEWILSHPVPPTAAFLAEMVSPLAANPAYTTAPLFCMMLLGWTFGFWPGVMGGLIIGIPLALAAACLNKTLELGAMLRFSVRTRGAILGLMSWLGYAGLLSPIFIIGKPGVWTVIATWLTPVSHWLHVPWMAWFLGAWTGDEVSWVRALVAGLAFSAMIIGVCVALSAWGTARGLESGFDGAPKTPRLVNLAQKSRFGRDPLLRKEILWFMRDRGALVQAILIPLTIAAMQAFNLRNLVEIAGQHWNSMAAIGVICGTYFLIVLGPRSLTSEGPALWLALTWPRGLEDLLKAKARFWWFLSTVVVIAILTYTVIRFPADLWKVALVAVGWWFFGRSLAEKSVTLVVAPSSSGQPEPIPRSRQSTAMLGTLAFGSGIMTQNWHLAVIGVVFSSLIAAAMWQNLRARLPYLYDPWSEKMPQAPTLMHAMVAIACMVEVVAVSMGIVIGISRFNPEVLPIAQPFIYGLVAGLACIIVHVFLKARGVTAREIWQWPQAAATPSPVRTWLHRHGLQNASGLLGVGAAAGVTLGLLGVGYVAILHHIPALQSFFAENAKAFRDVPNMRIGMGVIAIFLAPFAEEYLFRGLLFRALDREWGGWRAIVGSAVFFAIYHPPISWLPVGCLGLLNAWLFKNTGRLAPCVLCHMAYNAIVVGLGHS